MTKRCRPPPTRSRRLCSTILAETALNWPGRFPAQSGYSEPAAHRLLAGGDLLLHPSRFEPCGLTPLYALCYGTLPIVSAIGGLADTITDVAPDALRGGTANGFALREATVSAMLDGLDRALALHRQPVAWRRMQTTAMSQDFGWDESAHHLSQACTACVALRHERRGTEGNTSWIRRRDGHEY